MDALGGGCPTGVTPVGKRDPPQLPNIFQGTALQGRRCVRPCTSARPPVAKRGGGFGGDLAVFYIGTYDDSHVHGGSHSSTGWHPRNRAKGRLRRKGDYIVSDPDHPNPKYRLARFGVLDPALLPSIKAHIIHPSPTKKSAAYG